MNQLFEFIQHHWALWSAFGALLVFIIIYEIQYQKNRAKNVSPQEVVNLINQQNALLIDLRDLASYQKGAILHAIRVSPAEAIEKIQTMASNQARPIVLYCGNGLQSRTIGAQLYRKGLTQVNVLAGGIGAWRDANFPLVKNQ